MDSGRDRTEGDRHSPTRPRRQFLPACLHRLELPDRNGHAAARFRRPLPRRRCPPECATRPTILPRQIQECSACGRLLSCSAFPRARRRHAPPPPAVPQGSRPYRGLGWSALPAQPKMHVRDWTQAVPWFREETYVCQSARRRGNSWDENCASRSALSFRARSARGGSCGRRPDRSRLGFRMRSVSDMRRPSHDDGRDGVFEDQLFLAAGLKHHRIFVETTDAARQLDTAQKINRNAHPLLAGRVQEGILYVLRRLVIFHCRSPRFLDCKRRLRTTTPYEKHDNAQPQRRQPSPPVPEHTLRPHGAVPAPASSFAVTIRRSLALFNPRKTVPIRV